MLGAFQLQNYSLLKNRREPGQKAFTSKVQTERPTEKNGQMEKILGEIPVFITARG